MQMLHRPLIAMVAALALLSLAATACGQSPGSAARPTPAAKSSPTSALDKVSVDKSGFSNYPTWNSATETYDNATPGWTTAALVTNHSADKMATNVAVLTTAYDSSGRVIGTSTATFKVIPPHTTYAVAAVSFQAQGKIARIDVVAKPAAFQANRMPKGSVQGSGITGALSEGSEILFTVNGTLTNTYPRDLRAIPVVLVGLDASGHILGGAMSQAELAPAGQGGVSMVADFASPPASWMIIGMPDPQQLGVTHVCGQDEPWNHTGCTPAS
jgi:hypothetical protein